MLLVTQSCYITHLRGYVILYLYNIESLYVEWLSFAVGICDTQSGMTM